MNIYIFLHRLMHISTEIDFLKHLFKQFYGNNIF